MVRNFTVALVFGLLGCGTVQNAHAGWGSWGGSYGGYASGGSYGSYASSGSTGYSSHGSWGGYASTGGSHGSNGSWGGHHYGPLKRLFANIHARKAARRAYRHASYGSYGGSWGSSHGSYSSWGGSYGSAGYSSYGGSYGGWSHHGTAGCGGCGHCDACGGGCDGCDGGVIEGTVTPSMEVEPMEDVPSEARRSNNKGVLVVSVPADAQITVNGLATKSVGHQRRYVSHGLNRGEAYRYIVKATMEHNGETVEQTKVAMLRGGKTTTLDFDFDDAGVTETVLTLNVPADAKVYLSGNETRATGPERRFSTTRIAEGQKWADYTVQVTVNRDGRTLSKEQQVTLTGGDRTELSFEFGHTELADAR